MVKKLISISKEQEAKIKTLCTALEISFTSAMRKVIDYIQIDEINGKSCTDNIPKDIITENKNEEIVVNIPNTTEKKSRKIKKKEIVIEMDQRIGGASDSLVLRPPSKLKSEEESFVTLSEASKILRCSLPTIRKLVKSKKIPCKQVSARIVLIPRTYLNCEV